MRGALLPLALALAACSTRLPPAGVEAFHACDYGRAVRIFREKAGKADKDVVLYQLAILSSAMRAGEYGAAEEAGLAAQKTMWSDAGKTAGQASLVSAEAIKVFKGEPFEKAMAAVYTGIIFYNRGDYDNARASFAKAALAIKTKEKNREDFALAHLLSAKVALKEGDADNARIALEKARKVYGASPALDPDRLQKSNVLFLVEMGQAPQKIRSGPGGSLADWKRRNYPEAGVVVYVDGAERGRGSEVADLTVQAKGKGWTGKDTVQVTKGAARDAATVTAVVAGAEAARGNKTAGWVALGAGLFALANQSQADVRQWELLPDRIAALPARVEPGRRLVRLTFLNAAGIPLSGRDQLWYYDFAEGEEKILLFQSQACRRG